MKRYLCLFMTIVLSMSLFACSQSSSSVAKSWSSSKPLGDLYISAEIVSDSTVDIASEFEIIIGIGRFGDQYSTADIRIVAPELTISATNGTQFDNFYQIRYEDFNDSKYGLIMHDNIELKYFESVRFKYSGEKQNTQGCISFKLVTIDSDEEDLSGTAVGIYYEVKNGKVVISTERPVDYSPQNSLT